MFHSAVKPHEDTPRMKAVITASPTSETKRSVRFRTAEIFQILCFCVVAWAYQVASGAYRAEMAAYPDEPSHAVTGIMLDRYMSHPNIWHSPLSFVENYYLHYPKVAIGHWPPLLYIVQALTTILFGASRNTLLLLQAVLAGFLAASVFRLLRRKVGLGAAIVGALSLLCVRVIQVHTSMVMAEILLTLTMWLSTVAFARFAESESLLDALLFGFWTSAAILTKGTGWALGMVPVVVILLTRRWSLLKSPALWLSGAMIAGLTLPWQIATTHMASAGWDSDVPNLGYALRAGLFLTQMMFTVPGILLTVLGMFGLWFQIIVPWKMKAGVEPLPAALVGLVFADWFFHIAVPAGAETRKLIIAVPPWFLLAAYGAIGIASWLGARKVFAFRQRPFAAAILFSTVCAVGLVGSLPVTPKPEYGYISAARSLKSMMPPDTAVLVSSDSFGEGALVSELALLDPDPERYVVRGSKVLAVSEWNGRNRKVLAATPEDCQRILGSIPAGFIVMDLRPEVNDSEHQLLGSYLQSHPDWKLVGTFSAPNRPNAGVEIYRNEANVGPVRHLVINLQHTIGRDLSF